MIARVTLDLTLRKEFDYLVPPEFLQEVEVGTRVKVPFNSRQVLGSVTAIADQSPHTNLRPILKVIGRQPLLTTKVLQLARWIGEYYCCPLEVALRSVLPETVRKEQPGWRERLVVHAMGAPAEAPKLSKRQAAVLGPGAKGQRDAAAVIARAGGDDGRDGATPRGPRVSGDSRADFRARSVWRRNHSSHPSTPTESRATSRAQPGPDRDGFSPVESV